MQHISYFVKNSAESFFGFAYLSIYLIVHYLIAPYRFIISSSMFSTLILSAIILGLRRFDSVSPKKSFVYRNKIVHRIVNVT